MGQEVTLFGTGAIAVPKHIAERFASEESNLIEQGRQPALTIKGKVFTLQADGETVPLMKVDKETGDETPLGVLRVVIIDYGKVRGRSYYEGQFDENNVSPPKCWSRNSIVPDEDVPEKESPKCAGCPMSIKGSRLDGSGNPGYACGEHRILAVVPIKRLDMPALRLRIAVTSDYDGKSKELQEKGRFAFQQFIGYIKGRQVPHSSSIVTKLAFDASKAYPKLTFSPDRWLEPDELKAIDAIREGGTVEAILGDTASKPSTQRALAGPKVDAEAEVAAAAVAEAARVKAAAEAEAKAKAERIAAKKAAKKAEEDAAAAAKLASEQAALKAGNGKDVKFIPGAVDATSLGDDEDDEDEGGTIAEEEDEDEEAEETAAPVVAAAPVKPKGKGKPKVEAPAAVETALPADVSAMLADWDDE